MSGTTREVATLGGGCFWCIEAVLERLEGVEKVVSGYSGGHVENPSYEMVCSGQTGHAEVVQVTFDPSVLSYRDLLVVFFAMHDPTTLNRQGADVGTQYRSAMFFADDAQRERFEAARERAADWWPGEIVTTIEPLGDFFRAEEYHQDFFAKNPGQGYCLAVALPKANKIRRSYADYVLA